MKNRLLAITVSFIFLVLPLTGCHAASANQAVLSDSGISGPDQNPSDDSTESITDSDAEHTTESTAENATGDAFILSSVKMMNATAGWACNGNSIYRTADGGSHWTDVTPKYTVQPFGTVSYYLNADTSFVASSFENDSKITVSRTDNGGKSWKSVQISMDNPTTLYYTTSLNFTNSKCGWLMMQPDHGCNSEPGQLFSTTDGGVTWSLTATAVGMEVPYSKTNTNPLPFGGMISFRNADTGWVTGSFTTTTLNELYRTLDGGRTWQQQLLNLPANLSDGKLDIRTPPEFFSENSKEGILAASFDPNSGWAADCSEIFYTTHDGGTNWQAIKTVQGSEIPTDFVNSKEWWCWSAIPRDSGSTAPVQGKFYTTGNGGKTWEEISPDKTLGERLEKGQDITEVDFIDGKTGWVLMSANDMTTHTLFKTADGGETWRRIYH